MIRARKLPAAVWRQATLTPRAAFHSSAPAFVEAGDKLPDLNVLVENSPGNQVNLSKELTGNGLIIGVPAAFSMYPQIPNSIILE